LKPISLFMLLSMVVLGCIAAPAWADTIAVTNPSFEITNPLTFTAPDAGSWNAGPIPGWTTTGGGAGSWQPGPGLLSLPLPDGNTVAYSNGATLSQTLSASLVPDTTYTLSADVGHRFDGDVTNYTIELLLGGMVLDSISGSNGAIPLGAFQDVSFSYTSGSAPPPGNLGIALRSDGIQADFDNVRLSAVPEPGSLALLATGLGLALFVFRRR
jgi:hypothetical protein